MSTFKLTYFPIRLRAEPTRLVFAQAGVQYEDIRVQFPDWASLKPKTPMGQLPMLEDDKGNVLCQGPAICAYVASRFNMNGKNPLEAAQCLMFALGAEELFEAVHPYFKSQNEEEKKKLLEGAIEKSVKPFLKRHDGFLEKSSSGFLVGNEVTWADFAVYNYSAILLDNIDHLNLDDCPNFKAFMERIENLPKIKEWLKKRPPSTFKNMVSVYSSMPFQSIKNEVVVKFKLSYFPLKARAEATRMVFAQAGVPYEDIRVPFDEWPNFKSKTPMAQLPMLEDDKGRILCQAPAICAYVASRFHMNGKNPVEAAQCSMYALGAEDLWTAMTPYFRSEDEEEKNKLLEGVMEKNIEPFLKRYDGFLEKSSSGFLVGNGVTWADFVVYNYTAILLDNIDRINLDDCPNLKAFTEKIENLPKIKEWLQKRPQTQL